MAALIRNLRRRHFDLVVDFHSFRETNLLAWLSGAAVRIGMKRYKAPYLAFCFNAPPVIEDKQLHVTEMFQKVVGDIPVSVRPGPPSFNAFAHTSGTLGRLSTERASTPTVVLFIDAPVLERIWPPERFAAVADFAIENLDAAVIVISSNQRPDLASRVQQASRNPNRLSLMTDLTVRQLAAVIASAALLVSNDTGPMHLGPAVGVPTLGLFSVGFPEHFRPTGRNDRYLRANPIEEIQTGEVIRAVEEMWATADRDLRR
jgi:ADP-heptose:LPS heptosyltransferase